MRLFKKTASKDTTEADLETQPSDSTIILRTAMTNTNKIIISLIIAMASISVLISYADRTNISVAIVSMQKEYGWSDGTAGFVLSIFFLGYMLTQIAGGQMADVIGGKTVLSIGISVWSLCTLFTPQAAALNIVALESIRFVMGLGEGVGFPAIHSIISANVPVAFQSTSVAIVTAMSYAGTVFAFYISPILINKYGWEYVFYVFGLLAVIWLPFWLPLPIQKSSDNILDFEPLDSTSELNSQRDTETIKKTSFLDQKKAWLSNLTKSGTFKLLMKKEVWAICITQYTQSWGLYCLLEWLPSFFTDRYNIDISEVGYYTIVPYIVQALAGLTSGPMADYLINVKNYKIRNIRIVFQSIGMIGPAICLVLAVIPQVTGESAEACSAIITVGLGLSALSLAGVSVNHLDIAPKHAGAIFGAGNTFATLAGFVGVWVTGIILELTKGSWSTVFEVTALHYIVGIAAWVAWVGDTPLPEDNIS